MHSAHVRRQSLASSGQGTSCANPLNGAKQTICRQENRPPPPLPRRGLVRVSIGQSERLRSKSRRSSMSMPPNPSVEANTARLSLRDVANTPSGYATWWAT